MKINKKLFIVLVIVLTALLALALVEAIKVTVQGTGSNDGFVFTNFWFREFSGNFGPNTLEVAHTPTTGAGKFLLYGVQQARLDLIVKDGNIGIGTESPSTHLEIVSPTADALVTLTAIDTADNWNYINWNDENGRKYWTGIGGNGNFQLNPNAGTGLVLDGNGRVGIGLAPAEKFHVNGDVRVNGLAGTGNAYVCVDANGKLFRRNSPCV